MYAAILCAALVAGVVAGFEPKSALLIIDVQDCFLPGGSLAVSNSQSIIPVINEIRRRHFFDLVALSQDWHCPGHVSFASNHYRSNVSDVVSLRYDQNDVLCLSDTVTAEKFPGAVNCDGMGHTAQTALDQHLWPDHCVQGVYDGPTSAAFSSDLYIGPNDTVVQKGTNCQIDSYSAFFDNGDLSQTVLNQVLQDKQINMVFVVGLALDYCVRYTALDAKRLGYETYVVIDATRGVGPITSDQALKEMSKSGVHMIASQDIQEIMYMAVGEGPYSASSYPTGSLTVLIMACLTYIFTYITE